MNTLVCVNAQFPWRQAQQGRGEDEREAVLTRAVKPGVMTATLCLPTVELMFRNLNARLHSEGQRQNLTGGNVLRVVRLGKLGDGEPSIGQAHRRPRACPAQR